MKYKYLLLLLLVLPFISGCERSDDVAGIFTGKTWKLTYITIANSNNKPQPYDFWRNKEKYDNAIKEMNKDGAYTLTFTGTESDDMMDGAFNGILGTPLTFNGKWHADGKSNDFSASDVRSGGNKALLDSYFIEGMATAKRYEGNYDNLRLYYTYKDKMGTEVKMQMTFHVVK